jgi:uncharacterized paraquat-inducible protein A
LVSISAGKLHSRNYPPPTGWKRTPIIADLSKIARHYWRGFGFEHWIMQSRDNFNDSYGVVFPYWCPALMLAMLSTLSARRLWREIRMRRRLAAGLCLACGYDLRASTERCPECGTVIPIIAGTQRET